MRTFRHWTPRYVCNRIKEMLYRKRFQELPWLTKDANAIVGNLILETDTGVEFGSGRSTVWFAGKVKELLSVEHDQSWYNLVKSQLERKGAGNVHYHLAENEEKSYLQQVRALPDSSADFVLVDGMFRDLCAVEACRVLKPGGLLIIDNVNWYLPSDSVSPNSLKPGGNFTSRSWEQVWNQISKWRRIWTSSGVTDTALFFKPLSQ